MFSFFHPHNNFLTRNPWGAPGTAPNDDRARGYSPCGQLQKQDGGMYGRYDSRDFAKGAAVTEWHAGSVVDAAWSIGANHGGGYAYRLCKAPEGHGGSMAALTEECFQAGHLQFVGTHAYAQYDENVNSRKLIPAVQTTIGTYPPGSQWRRNPIPAWKCASGGRQGYRFDNVTPNPDQCHEFNFHPASPDLAGYGLHIHKPGQVFKFHIVDQLQVPHDLAPGDYVLSWRWDCEQTPQVWSHCSNIKVVPGPSETWRESKPRLDEQDQHNLAKWEKIPGRACAAHTGDTSKRAGGSGHKVNRKAENVEVCMWYCEQEIDCTGIAFAEHLTHCEIWTEPITHDVPAKGFTCMKKVKAHSLQRLFLQKGEELGTSTASQSVTIGVAVFAALVAMISMAAVISRRRGMLNRRMSDAMAASSSEQESSEELE